MPAVVERDGALLPMRRARHLLEGGTWGLVSFDHGDTVRAYLAAGGQLPPVPALI